MNNQLLTVSRWGGWLRTVLLALVASVILGQGVAAATASRPGWLADEMTGTLPEVAQPLAWRALAGNLPSADRQPATRQQRARIMEAFGRSPENVVSQPTAKPYLAAVARHSASTSASVA